MRKACLAILLSLSLAAVAPVSAFAAPQLDAIAYRASLSELTAGGSAGPAGIDGILLAQQVQDDVIHLNNGRVLRGQIIEVLPDSLRLRQRDGLVVEIPRASIGSMEKVASDAVTGGKSPVLAFLLSTLLAGGGQFYNGEHGKGAIQFGGHVAGLGLGVLAGLSSLGGRSGGGDVLGLLFFGLFFGCKLWSMIDAPLAAGAINRQLEQEQRLSFSFGMTQHAGGVVANLSF